MSRELRKKVLITLAAVVAALFAIGGFAAFMSRNDTICSDGKVPLAAARPRPRSGAVPVPGRRDREQAVSQPADAGVAPEASPARDWWLRLVLVLTAPRAVLRGTSRRVATGRRQPLRAGAARRVARGHRVGSDDLDRRAPDGLAGLRRPARRGVDVPRRRALRRLRLLGLRRRALRRHARARLTAGSFRRSRHLLAYAAVPVALSLALLPVKLALYGDDVFHRGGADAGRGRDRLRRALGRVPALVARPARARHPDDSALVVEPHGRGGWHERAAAAARRARAQRAVVVASR